MRFNGNEKNSSIASWILVIGILFISGILIQSTQAQPDYIFFSVNGDTTATTMTQGNEFYWGSNCTVGATINWEIWIDVNSNSIIEPSTDALLASENITDGSLLYEENPVPDGYAIALSFNLSGEPGQYIFKAIDVKTSVTTQKTINMIAIPSPPNKFTGQIIIPGVMAPNAMLANRVVYAEAESGFEGAVFATTNNMGVYSLIITADGGGVDFYIAAANLPGYVTPDPIIATAAGFVSVDDMAYVAAVDSVWGMVKDQSGDPLGFETDVSAWSDGAEKYTTTRNGRYVIYFSNSDKGDYTIESDSRVSPAYLSPFGFNFSHDTLSSFSHDLTLISTNAVINVRVVENGSAPISAHYRINAYSQALQSTSEAVTGSGFNNTVAIGVSSLDATSWEISIDPYDDEFPIPFGLILEFGGQVMGVAPGNTVEIGLINGYLVSGMLTLDPEDAPIIWADLYVFAGSWGARVADGGAYGFYADTGSMWLGVYSDAGLGFLSDPAYRLFDVTGPTNVPDITINRTHCTVSGAISNVSLPLDGSFYNVVARTGTNGSNGYEAFAPLDPNTGTYSLDLCDGEWTITAPDFFGAVFPPDPTLLTIGEIPDTIRTVNFAYSSGGCCGEFAGGMTGNTNCGSDGKRNLADITRLVDRVYLTKTILCCEENGNVNGDVDAKLNLADITRLVDNVYLTKAETAPCM